MYRRMSWALLVPAAITPLVLSTTVASAEVRTGAPTGASVTSAAVATSTTGSVKELQQRLKWAGVYTGDVSGTMTTSTRTAVKRFQGKFSLYVDGIAGPKTWTKLRAVTEHGYGIDRRCKTAGKVICIDKTLKISRAMKGGKIVRQNDARFGRRSLPTREGTFKVYRKSRDHVSSLYDAYMPFALFFSRGQAVHYSPDFVRYGYQTASHGCVGLRSWSGAEALFDWAPIGTKVVIYRS